MIKYRTRYNAIEVVAVLRETKKQVVLRAKNGARQIREAKVSGWSNWHDTWEDAHAFLLRNAEQSVEHLRIRLDRAKGELAQIRGMKPND